MIIGIQLINLDSLLDGELRVINRIFDYKK